MIISGQEHHLFMLENRSTRMLNMSLEKLGESLAGNLWYIPNFIFHN